MSRSRSSALESLAFLGPAVANAFEELRVSSALRTGGPWRVGDGGLWRSIHVVPSVSRFEIEYGLERQRERYTTRALNLAWRAGRTVCGQHAGFSDLFVPIRLRDRVVAVLVTGPFARARPTSAELQGRWRSLTGRQAHPSDPEFAHYVSLTLSTLVLEGKGASQFERFLELLADLSSGAGGAERALAEADALRAELSQSRAAEQCWEVAHALSDERTGREWSSPQRADHLESVGLSRVPDHALVGLMVNRRSDIDPVDDLLCRDALQRACTDLARRTGEVIAGQVGDHGVMFLAVATGRRERRSGKLLDLADRSLALARRFDFEFYFGVSGLPQTANAAEHYQAALSGAELALSRRARLMTSAPEVGRRSSPLHELRKALGRVIEERPREVLPHFERYLELVAMRSGYRLEPARVYLEAGFEQVADVLLGARALSERAYADASAALERKSRDSRTITELYSVYRLVMLDLSNAVQRPTLAKHDRSLRRAIEYIQRHYAEPLRRAAVARVAGFAPVYFSELFKRQEGIVFERYVQKLRIDRVKQLLAGTDLGLQRVAELSGLRTRIYLGHVFKRVVGVTPLAWRRSQR